jgi:hypothetical protein
MDPPLAAGIDLRSDDQRLKVRFCWVVDRFVHQLLIDEQVVACSVDGDGQTTWPPSPPIQQLSLEHINGSDVILGVGAAGRGHWSLSAQFELSDTVTFELACRSKDQPKFLGSTYRLADSVCMQAADDRTQVDGMIARLATFEGPTYRWSYRLKTS